LQQQVLFSFSLALLYVKKPRICAVFILQNTYLFK